MHHVKVKSSQIASIAFDPIDQRLAVRFLCSCKGGDAKCLKCKGTGEGAEYHYEGVPQSHYIALRDEKDSVGKKFAALIKAGPYKFKKVSA
jgi:hypothetical protein